MATPQKKKRRVTSRKPSKPADPFAGCAAEFRALRQLAGKNVRAWRERRGLTQGQLSARSGVSPTTIDHVERGWGNRSIVIHAKIAHALGVPMCKFWEGDEIVFKSLISKPARPVRRRLKGG